MLRAITGLTTIGALLLFVGSAHAQGYVVGPNHDDHWDHHDRIDHEHGDRDHRDQHVEYRYQPRADYRVSYVPAPVYVAPRATYYAPQQTYYAPQPTCVVPRTEVVVPQPVYYPPHVGLSLSGRNFSFSVGH